MFYSHIFILLLFTKKNVICNCLSFSFNVGIFSKSTRKSLNASVNFLEKYKFIGVGRDDGEKKGEFCAIYFDTTLYEILDYSTFWLSETPDLVSVGWDASLERICTYGLFASTHSGEKFWVFNTH